MDQTCNHECCNCVVPPTRDDGYCSDECVQLDRGDDHACDCTCGHPGCQIEESVASSDLCL